MSHTIEIDLYGRTITLETGKVAKQARRIRQHFDIRGVAPDHQIVFGMTLNLGKVD